MDPVATVLQPRDAFPPIAQQPRVHALRLTPYRSATSSPESPRRLPARHVSLLGHAQLPQHERECQASNDQSVKHQAGQHKRAVQRV